MGKPDAGNDPYIEVIKKLPTPFWYAVFGGLFRGYSGLDSVVRWTQIK